MGLITALEAVRKLEKDIYIVTFPDDTEVIFKLPSYKQASQYAQLLKIAENNISLETIVYNHIFEACVVDDYLAVHDQNLKAGIPETTSKVILYLSGADDHFKEYTQDLLELFRSRTQSIISLMRRNICQVFSGYKMSDLDNMTFQDLIQVYVEAETVLLEQGIIEEGLKFAEPKEEKPFSIESAITQDAKEFQRYDAPDGGSHSKLTDDPAYKARMEEFRVKQKLNKLQGG